MKKTKALAAISVAAVMAITGAALAGCDGGKNGDKSYSFVLNSSDDSSPNYAALSAWESIPVPYQVNGGTAGAGFVNLDVWGAKKFKLGSDDTIFGTGLYYTVKVEVTSEVSSAVPASVSISGDKYYALSIDAHVIGEGSEYEGEGDCIYTWYGVASEVEGGYKLEAAKYTSVEVTGTIKIKNSSTQFLPSAPFKCDSLEADGSYGQGKIKTKYLNFLFMGATVQVSGDSITAFKNVTINSNWN